MTVDIVLMNPKYPHNVGAAVRAASCWGARQVLFTGNRVQQIVDEAGRLPREERMRDYANVMWLPVERPFDHLDSGVTPVAVEFAEGYTNLFDFDHPEHAAYVFGPEDGTLSRATLGQCHRFVKIPSRHCLNLAAAVNVVLYDRAMKGRWIVPPSVDNWVFAQEAEGDRG